MDKRPASEPKPRCVYSGITAGDCKYSPATSVMLFYAGSCSSSLEINPPRFPILWPMPPWSAALGANLLRPCREARVPDSSEISFTIVNGTYSLESVKWIAATHVGSHLPTCPPGFSGCWRGGTASWPAIWTGYSKWLLLLLSLISVALPAAHLRLLHGTPVCLTHCLKIPGLEPKIESSSDKQFRNYDLGYSQF